MYRWEYFIGIVCCFYNGHLASVLGDDDATNPGQVTTCPDDWTPYQDSCYALIDFRETFSGAAELCERLNGYLAEITNAEENTFVKNFVTNKTSTNYVWIGGSDLLADGDWKWLFSREKIRYYDWAPGEPITGPTNRCIQLWHSHGYQWDDFHCDQKNMFLCETSSEPGPAFGK